MPEPTYSGVGWELYVGDCLAVLPGLTGVDAVVTDPPYNVGLKYGKYDDNKKESSFLSWCRDWFFVLDQMCDGCIAISVGVSNVTKWETIRRPDWWLAWNKPAAMGRCFVGFNNWEPIALWRKPPRQICDSFKACIVSDIEVDGHPCPKPIGWALWQVRNLSIGSATVLDPFCGTGTVGVACLRTGRRFIGIEIDEHYAQIAAKRLARAEADVRNSLPFPEPEPQPKQVTMWEASDA